MLFSKCFKLHEQLEKALGDDLIFSLAKEFDKYILTVSTHKSTKQQFKHGKVMQLCHFTKEDLELDSNKVLDVLIAKYKEILTEKVVIEDPMDEEVETIPTVITNVID